MLIWNNDILINIFHACCFDKQHSPQKCMNEYIIQRVIYVVYNYISEQLEDFEMEYSLLNLHKYISQRKNNLVMHTN